MARIDGIKFYSEGFEFYKEDSDDNDNDDDSDGEEDDDGDDGDDGVADNNNNTSLRV